MTRTVRLLGFFALTPLALAQFKTTLNPKATEAFEAYRTSVESQMNHQPRYRDLPAGTVRIDPGRSDGVIAVNHGMVHDWVGATFIPNATAEQVVAVLQNYAAYKTVYAPDVIDSRLLNRSGDRFRVYLKVLKHNVLTVTLNTEYEVEYLSLGDGRWAVNSRSTRIAEVDKGRELPPGTGHGFLWRLNAYWLLEPRGNGTYIECRSLSLSRDIPTGLGFVVKPFVRSLPVDSLRATLTSTARALKR